MIDLSKIVQHEFPAREYFQEEFEKIQIVLHHTVSPVGVSGDINWWLKDKVRVGTCVLVDNTGTIHQVFSSKFWAYHLGLGSKHFKKIGVPYRNLDRTSIGIEIDSLGGLKKDGDKWKSVYGHVVPSERVIEYPEGYRGFYAFERYTDAQIQSVKDLLEFWKTRYKIPLDYNEDMFDVSKDAMTGKPGVWSHTSFRYDKSDIHPQPELIQMLKSLK